eukprot:TRINITY_DN66349_c5_g11_i1.p1 TRINITY_DN66349_c5_g11~~TRINITY_DN66349_c5_g11_i1.p1  ORF type:complete len:526 (-),score=294.35 TRINITY_DN66349_c5_g11_i1:187-1764(-)
MPPQQVSSSSSSSRRSQGKGGKGVTMAEVLKHDGANAANGGEMWTVIDNNVYDITKFVSQHPGGRVVKLAAGRNATALLEVYHPTQSFGKVDQVLKNRCPLVGPLVEDDEFEDVDDTFWVTVRNRVDKFVAAQGTTRHWHEWVIFAELAVTLLLWCYCVYHKAVTGSFLAVFFAGIFNGRFGLMMHHGNHGGASSSSTVNEWFGSLMNLAGASDLIWMNEHNVSHHLDPNESGRDNDAEIGNPLLRFHPALPRRSIHRFQHIYTFIGMGFGTIKWVVSDFMNFWEGAVGHVVFHPTKKDWQFILFSKSLFFVLHVFAPWYFHGPAYALKAFLLFMATTAYYMEMIFITNHISSGLSPVAPKEAHWAVRNCLATVNWSSTSHIANIISGGLCHQVEHHLFPSVSSYLYPRISPIVRQTCEEFGIPYHTEKSFFTAWIRMATFLRDLGTPKYDDWVQPTMKEAVDLDKYNAAVNKYSQRYAQLGKTNLDASDPDFDGNAVSSSSSNNNNNAAPSASPLRKRRSKRAD